MKALVARLLDPWKVAFCPRCHRRMATIQLSVDVRLPLDQLAQRSVKACSICQSVYEYRSPPMRVLVCFVLGPCVGVFLATVALALLAKASGLRPSLTFVFYVGFGASICSNLFLMKKWPLEWLEPSQVIGELESLHVHLSAANRHTDAERVHGELVSLLSALGRSAPQLSQPTH